MTEWTDGFEQMKKMKRMNEWMDGWIWANEQMKGKWICWNNERMNEWMNSKQMRMIKNKLKGKRDVFFFYK